MKTRTVDAARRLGIHPSQFLQRIAELAPQLTFNDVWPEIDKDWVDTISAIDHMPPRQDSGRLPADGERPALMHGLSCSAVHVLDKLHRQRKYGNVSVAFDALMNLAHVAKRDLEDVVAELRKADLLSHDGTGRGTISLNPAKRNEIEVIAQQAH